MYIGKKKLEELEYRIKILEKCQKNQKPNTAIEQYKILFNIIINLNDNVVKSILTIFLIYTAIVALVMRGITTTPQIKNILYINYGLILVFSYYLGYLRFRIITMFSLVEEIEKGENFKYGNMQNYERKTNYRFFSTKGLFFIVVMSLIATNTILIIIL